MNTEERTKERTKERKDIVNLRGSRELRKTFFTLTCQRPDVKTHTTCIGCLCPCHDGE
jgi:hypothetical protein